jgi:hypothetical protein
LFSLTVQNKYGQRLELTHNADYVISNIDGIDPPDATINTTRNGVADGSVFNSAFIENRIITISLAVNAPTEQNRIKLYKYFTPKSKIRLFYKNETRNVFIDGYVQTVPVSYFIKKETVMITIFCNDPYFKDVDENITDFSSVQPLFEFPFEIEEADPIEFSQLLINQEQIIFNSGDVETGALFIMRATGEVVNPSIYNTESGEYITLNITMQEGDEIQISTVKKQKFVTLISNGVKTNIIGNLKSGSTWLQLQPADNIFTTSAEENPENLETFCVLNILYMGV